MGRPPRSGRAIKGAAKALGEVDGPQRGLGGPQKEFEGPQKELGGPGGWTKENSYRNYGVIPRIWLYHWSLPPMGRHIAFPVNPNFPPCWALWSEVKLYTKKKHD